MVFQMDKFQTILALMFLIIFVNNVIYFTILTFHLQEDPELPEYMTGSKNAANLEHDINERPHNSPTKISFVFPISKKRVYEIKHPSLPNISVFPDRKYMTGSKNAANLEHTINERHHNSPTKIMGMLLQLTEFRNFKKTGRLPVKFAKIVGD
ncbi:hypothetical protein DERP_002504 [Dermatophagoides pteronyssinus]|uniref:Uncharacterized protein n=1 Tax=Dermatophagoides pteronyssinus TaxID=6956 RepID=A0ABQ8JIE8_DERPT|nr:hypothetical protein DERP_002504 [Dermatophagoides pteronyssinus]